MSSIPAFCDNCGAVFSSGFNINNSQNVSLKNNRVGPCPRCGGMGHISDGKFNFIGDSIEVLSAPTRTLDELTRLAQIINEAREKNQAPQFVSKRIEEEIPSLANFASFLPESRNELYGFFTLILALLTFLTPFFLNSQRPPEISIDQVIKAAIQSYELGKRTLPDASANISTNLESSKRVWSTQAVPQKSRKIGRNDPCPCGKNNKYKRCCGANR